MQADLSFDHLGVACPSLDAGRAFLQAALGVRNWTGATTDPIQKVHVQFGKDRMGTVFELIAPSEADSPIAAALKSHKNILNHLAYRTPDIAAARTALEAQGCLAISPASPAVAFDNALIQFFYSPLDFIIELIEQKETTHVFELTFQDDMPAGKGC
jgi:methylmalonyl-CoA/ethylmalonyl-CoA epimerase